MFGSVWWREFDVIDSWKAVELEFWCDEMNHDVEEGAGHDVDEESVGLQSVSVELISAGKERWVSTYDVTLSRLWKTKLLRHIAIATALLPKARQYVEMNRRFECGKNHMLRIIRKLTK